MEDNPTIYAVSSGEYSGYCVNALFSTEEKAKEYIEHTIDPEYYRIEEFILDGLGPDRSDKLFTIEIDYETFDAEITGRNYPSHRTLKEYINTFQTAENFRVRMYIVADSPKRAIKIASERLGQIKAEEWKYPLLHEKILLVRKHDKNILGHIMKRHLGGMPPEYRYPLYRFGTGEMIIPDGYELSDYELI